MSPGGPSGGVGEVPRGLRFQIGTPSACLAAADQTVGLVENTASIATPNEFVKEQLETRLPAAS